MSLDFCMAKWPSQTGMISWPKITFSSNDLYLKSLLSRTVIYLKYDSHAVSHSQEYDSIHTSVGETNKHTT